MHILSSIFGAVHSARLMQEGLSDGTREGFFLKLENYEQEYSPKNRKVYD